MNDHSDQQVANQIDVLHQRVAELERLLARTSVAESNWRALLTNAPDFVLIINPDGAIRYINHLAPGFSMDDVIGSCAFDYVLDEFKDSMRAHLDEVLETGTVRQLEVPSVGPDGETAWYGVRVGPFKENDRIVAATCIATDITDRVKSERTRQEVERRMNTICSVSPVGILRFDAHGQCVYINRRYCEITGRSTWELLADGWTRSIDANDRERVLNQWQTHCESETGYRKEYRVVRTNGEVRWVYSQISAERDDQSEIIGYVGTVTDITSRKEQEEELKTDERLLRKLLDLQERERKLIAHDIHDGFVQDVVGAKMLLEAVIDEQAVRGTGHEAFEKATSLLSQAIEEARRMIGELRPLIIDERGIVQAINYLVHDERFCQGVKVGFSHNVQFDRLDSMLEGTLFRIVQEALTNVVRHSKSPTATVDFTESDTMLNLEIQDEGVGMDLDKLPEDRFGLRGIRERARLFGGHAEITSAPDQGTQIYVSIPRTGV